MALLSSLWLAGCSVVGIRTVEEPAHLTRARIGAIEIRDYAKRVAAETMVAKGELRAREVGFSRIAGYIFGANQDRSKIAMTAPVAQDRAEDRAQAGAWRVSFFMPAGQTLRTLPQPNDPAVRLVDVPAQTVAVLRFSGTAGPVSVARETRALLDGLAGSAWSPVGQPVVWFYDPPWTLPPLRRNEVAVEVRGRSRDAKSDSETTGFQ